MAKIITRCFQGGGAFLNAYRFLAKSALTAFALIAATFTANAVDTTIDAKAGATATTEQKNLLQTGADGGTVTVQGSGDKGLTVNFDANTKFTTHIVFDGGVHTVNSNNNGNPKSGVAEGYIVCDNSSNSNPMWLVKNGTTLNFTAKDFGGWNSASLADTCVIAVENGGIINLINQSGKTFYNRNRWLLNPDATMNLNSESDKFNIIGGTESGKEQLYVPAGSGTATIGRSGNTGSLRIASESTAGAAAFVGEGATLAVNVPFISKDANSPFVKRGAGTMVFSSDVNSMKGDFTVEAGTVRITSNSKNSLLGNVTITNGTIETTQNYTIANGSTARMTVGEGGTFIPKDLIVGDNSGKATLTVENGGVVRVGTATGKSWLKFYSTAEGNATVNLKSGGVIEACVITHETSTAQSVINFDGGILKAYAGTDFSRDLLDDEYIVVNVLSSGAIFEY